MYYNDWLSSAWCMDNYLPSRSEFLIDHHNVYSLNYKMCFVWFTQNMRTHIPSSSTVCVPSFTIIFSFTRYGNVLFSFSLIHKPIRDAKLQWGTVGTNVTATIKPWSYISRSLKKCCTLRAISHCYNYCYCYYLLLL